MFYITKIKPKIKHRAKIKKKKGKTKIANTKK